MPSLNEHTLVHREKLLRRLGQQGLQSIVQMPYERYLRSTLWQSIRDWVIEMQAGQCSVCHHKAAEVHHHDYDEETMLGERSDGLVGLCGRCHGLIEFDEQKNKRQDLNEKRATFERLRECYQRFQAEGFCLRLNAVGLKMTVEYVGPSEYLRFMNCSSVAYEFIVSVPYSELSFPLPLGREKLTQKTGIRLSLRETAKHVATVWADVDEITMHRKKACPFPLAVRLREFLASKQFVRLAE
jgi:hypothetical protein